MFVAEGGSTCFSKPAKPCGKMRVSRRDIGVRMLALLGEGDPAGRPKMTEQFESAGESKGELAAAVR